MHVHAQVFIFMFMCACTSMYVRLWYSEANIGSFPKNVLFSCISTLYLETESLTEPRVRQASQKPCRTFYLSPQSGDYTLMSAWLSVWASGFRSQTFMLEVNE